MSTLRLANALALPLDFVTKTAAILAQRRKGKTYTASVLAEELHDAGQPWVALDPTGAWWGLRSSADGEGPGIPVVILGGQHGDLPLERTAGRFVADLVVEHPGWYVLDLSLFESKAAERQFATDFADRLYRRKGQAGADFPLHLFVDEADMFVPQDRDTGDAAMLGAFQAIVRRGGLRGIGTTLISQRAALVNKSVLEQLDMLLLLRTVGPNDRKAVEGYIKAHGTDIERAELLGSLASLAVGEAWVWEPGAEPPLFQRVQVRARHTFNSSATPKPGERRVEPRRLAEVDLVSVKEAMADTIEKAKADDPKELRKRIAALEREIAATAKAVPESVVTVEQVEVLVVNPAVPLALQAAIQSIDRAIEQTQVTRDFLADQLAGLEAKRAEQRSTSPTPSVTRPTGGDAHARVPNQPAAAPVAPRQRAPRGGDTPVGGLPGPQRKLLTVLATYGPRTKRQLAMQAGYSMGGGGFNNPLGALRSAGYIDPPKGEPMAITDAGITALGDYDPLPAGQDLIDHWLGQLPGPAKKILQVIIDHHPDPLTKEALAEAAGYAPVGGGFNNPLGRLRTLELVTRGPEIGLTDDFAEAIR